MILKPSWNFLKAMTVFCIFLIFKIEFDSFFLPKCKKKGHNNDRKEVCQMSKKQNQNTDKNRNNSFNDQKNDSFRNEKKDEQYSDKQSKQELR